MIETLFSYQVEGLRKLLTFAPGFCQRGVQNDIPSPALSRQMRDFTRIFCEYGLADTDYDRLQRESSRYASRDEYIGHMQLEEALKAMTYVLWTDKIIQGFFAARVRDNYMSALLARVGALIQSSPPPKTTGMPMRMA